jgi:hypothetical protein
LAYQKFKVQEIIAENKLKKQKYPQQDYIKLVVQETEENFNEYTGSKGLTDLIKTKEK